MLNSILKSSDNLIVFMQFIKINKDVEVGGGGLLKEVYPVLLCMHNPPRLFLVNFLKFFCSLK